MWLLIIKSAEIQHCIQTLLLVDKGEIGTVSGESISCVA